MDETNQEQTAAYPVRITNHSKLKVYISSALDFFDKNKDTPILFHTLPPGYLTSSKDERERKRPRLDAGPSTDNPDQREPTKSRSQRAANSSTKPVTETIPRLITVVEIIKREFLKNLALKHSPRLAGLYQYTEIGCLEDVQKSNAEETSSVPSAGAEEEEDDLEELFDERAKEVVEALSGKNHVRRKRTPYMKITLSLTTIPALEEQGASYQAPTIRKLSKSAKSRARKREHKHRAEPGVENDGNSRETSE
ncbi:hypothetical protein JOM56_000506 [Amanita muscaria]